MPTVSEYLLQGAGRLSFGPHSDRARADAELLLMNLLGINRAWLVANAHAEIGFEHWEPYDALLERRYGGEPIQYITGECEFYGLPFKVTRDVLIPRPETEHLVEKVIEAAQGFTRPHIVDVGTGSGILALAAAKLGAASVLALDVSSVAVEAAQANAQANVLAGRITVRPGSLEETPETTYDLVVANIIARVIADLAPALVASLAPGGLLIASGIIDERLALAEDALRAAGLAAIERVQEGDWFSLVGRSSR